MRSRYCFGADYVILIFFGRLWAPSALFIPLPAMVIFSVIAVLLLEQIRPMPYAWLVRSPLGQLAAFLERRFDAGERHNGAFTWAVAVGGLVIVAGAVFAVLDAINPLLAWGWNVAILYLTLGFRQFSHYYSAIQFALRMDDLSHARVLLAEWRGSPCDGLTASEVARLAIEQALLAAHRHVFGVLACFVLLPGPCGAVLYRVAAEFAEVWGQRSADPDDGFARFARQAFTVVDWLPLRLTAAAFAIVGNFEDAMFSWRSRGDSAVEDVSIVLASGAGALGVRLGGANEASGEAADPGHMQSAVALVWRALLLWLLLLFLLSLAGLIAA